jgi:hypothetical protein
MGYFLWFQVSFCEISPKKGQNLPPVEGQKQPPTEEKRGFCLFRQNPLNTKKQLFG